MTRRCWQEIGRLFWGQSIHQASTCISQTGEQARPVVICFIARRESSHTYRQTCQSEGPVQARNSDPSTIPAWSLVAPASHTNTSTAPAQSATRGSWEYRDALRTLPRAPSDERSTQCIVPASRGQAKVLCSCEMDYAACPFNDAVRNEGRSPTRVEHLHVRVFGKLLELLLWGGGGSAPPGRAMNQCCQCWNLAHRPPTGE